MPYAIRKRGGKFVVTKAHGDTRVIGTHDDRASAERQIRAIYANERKK